MAENARFTFAVLGAGGRGMLFARWVHDHPEMGRVVAVAEPAEDRRRQVAEMCDIAPEMQFERWEDLAAKPKLADAVINATMDQLHAPSAVAVLERGYHMMLEKPMAVTLEDCIAIDRARRESGRIVSVCHSLRYQTTYAEVKRLLDSGAIGRLVSLDQLEGVEARHQSHSFVRGNWGNEGRSTFMLMSKSCHDVDLIAWLIGESCERVSSFGSLSYFTAENAPAGATDRCTDGCAVEHECPYSAIRIYGGRTAGWISDAAKLPEDHDARIEALKTSPYNRCAFRCDNDVVDHQVVAFEFAEGITATFTMTAFHPGDRFMRLHGTEGYIEATLGPNAIRLHRFADHAEQQITIPPQPGGHGGGDDLVMRTFVRAMRENDPTVVRTGTDESLATHRIVFAAELARRERRVVELSELEAVESLEMPALMA